MNISIIDNDVEASTPTPYIGIRLHQQRAIIDENNDNKSTQVMGDILYNFPLDFLDNDTCIVNLTCEVRLDEIEIDISPRIVEIHDWDANDYYSDCQYGNVEFTITFTKIECDYYLSSSLRKYFFIDGSWKLENSSKMGEFEKVAGEISFEKVYDFEAYYPNDENQYSGPIGKWKTIPIRIVNNGNTELEIWTTLSLHQDPNLDISLNHMKIILPENEEVIVNLSVRQIEGNSNDHQIAVHIRCQSGDYEEDKWISVPFNTHHTLNSYVDFFIDSDCALIVILILWISFCAICGYQTSRYKRKEKKKRLQIQVKTIIIIAIFVIICVWIIGLSFIYCRLTSYLM